MSKSVLKKLFVINKAREREREKERERECVCVWEREKEKHGGYFPDAERQKSNLKYAITNGQAGRRIFESF